MHLNAVPKIGLALSGASARSVFYIGFLEVLQENNVAIDYISSNSGSCIVAAAFACGTLTDLREQIFAMNKEFLFSLFEKSKDNGGLFSLDKAEEELRKYTKNLKFEEVRPLMGFTCTNINTGEEVVLSMGDIARAICASSAVPGIFDPIRWGPWDLVDGGLINTVPGEAAKVAGCDFIIGIDLSPRKNVFGKLEVGIKKIMSFFYRLFFLDKAKWAFENLVIFLQKNPYFDYFWNLEQEEGEMPRPGMFEVLGKAIDISIAAEKRNKPRENNFGCDLLLSPTFPFVPAWKHLKNIYFPTADLTDSRQLYQSGRAMAKSRLAEIKSLIRQKALKMAAEQGLPPDVVTINAK